MENVVDTKHTALLGPLMFLQAFCLRSLLELSRWLCKAGTRPLFSKVSKPSTGAWGDQMLSRTHIYFFLCAIFIFCGFLAVGSHASLCKLPVGFRFWWGGPACFPWRPCSLWTKWPVRFFFFFFASEILKGRLCLWCSPAKHSAKYTGLQKTSLLKPSVYQVLCWAQGEYKDEPPTPSHERKALCGVTEEAKDGF